MENRIPSSNFEDQKNKKLDFKSQNYNEKPYPDFNAI